MVLIKKGLAIVAMMMMFATANAYQNDCDPEPVCPESPPCCDVPVAPTVAAYNHPANIDVCGSWDFYVTGSFLYWQSIEEQLYAGATSPSTDDIRLIEFDWDWKPAFKVGIGYVWGYDNWDVYLNYTRYNSSMGSSLTKPDGGFLFPIWVTIPEGEQTRGQDSITFDANSVSNSWSLDHNMFDLEFARPYYNGKCLIFKAHYGLRAGWIDQKFDETAKVTTTITPGSEPPQTIEEEFKANAATDCWLIGPRIGIYSKWMLGEGFRLFGNGAMNIFYQKFTKSFYQQLATTFVTETNKLSHSHENISMSADMLLGAAWGTYFDRNNWHFDVSLGYEIQIFFDQNLMKVMQQLSAFGGSQTKAGDLTFHGLNLAARFDF